jgi:hypothetical protein
MTSMAAGTAVTAQIRNANGISLINQPFSQGRIAASMFSQAVGNHDFSFTDIRRKPPAVIYALVATVSYCSFSVPHKCFLLNTAKMVCC